MSGASERVVEAAFCLRDALQATNEVRVRHQVPNSWCAMAILLHAVPGRVVSAAALDPFGSNSSYLVKGLLDAGLIEEARVAHDRRALALRLTEHGAAVADELRRALGGVG